MDLLNQLDDLLPLTCNWVEEQERLIISKGIALSKALSADARKIGVSNVDHVRLLKIDRIPLPDNRTLRTAAAQTNFLSPDTAGITFRYGIYIRSDKWNDRSLIVHELTHTKQYERFGSIETFLRQYLTECFTVGYLNSPLEQEARQMEHQF